MPLSSSSKEIVGFGVTHKVVEEFFRKILIPLNCKIVEDN